MGIRVAPAAAPALLAVSLVTVSLVAAPAAAADNNRFNESVVADVHALMMMNGCTDDLHIESMVRVNPKLRLAAQWQGAVASPPRPEPPG